MLEVEMKIQIRDEQQLRAQLQELGATKIVNLEHIDRYYDRPTSQTSFALTDEALRLRRSSESDPTTSEILRLKNDLTYKGPKEPGVIKSRKEIICEISHPDELDGILISLGYIMRCKIEKHREVFHVLYQDKEIEILIDRVEGLTGTFMEAEIMVDSKDLGSRDEEKNLATTILLQLLHELHYAEADSIIESYLELYIAANEPN
ncbi:MAG: class IV adenylate cyclase [Promethearchaeota archaeon]